MDSTLFHLPEYQENKNILSDIPLDETTATINEAFHEQTQLPQQIDDMEENEGEEEQEQEQKQQQQHDGTVTVPSSSQSSYLSKSASRIKINSLHRLIDTVTWKKRSNNVDEDVVTISSSSSAEYRKCDGDDALKVSEANSSKTNSLSRRLRFRTHRRVVSTQTENKHHQNNSNEQLEQQDGTATNSDGRKSLRRFLSTYWNTIFKRTSKISNSIPQEPSSNNVKNENQIQIIQNLNDVEIRDKNVSIVEEQELIERTEIALNLNENNIIQETVLKVG